MLQTELVYAKPGVLPKPRSTLTLTQQVKETSELFFPETILQSHDVAFNENIAENASKSIKDAFSNSYKEVIF